MNALKWDAPPPKVPHSRSTLTIRQRFEAKFEPEPNSGCWLWTGSVGSHGYGQINIDGLPTVAHRVSYEMNVGPIPEGLHLDHLCRVRICVNPRHLEPVTSLENFRRGWVGGNPRATHFPCGHEKADHATGKGTRCRTCNVEWQRQHPTRRQADGTKRRASAGEVIAELQAALRELRATVERLEVQMKEAQ